MISASHASSAGLPCAPNRFIWPLQSFQLFFRDVGRAPAPASPSCKLQVCRRAPADRCRLLQRFNTAPVVCRRAGAACKSGPLPGGGGAAAAAGGRRLVCTGKPLQLLQFIAAGPLSLHALLLVTRRLRSGHMSLSLRRFLGRRVQLAWVRKACRRGGRQSMHRRAMQAANRSRGHRRRQKWQHHRVVLLLAKQIASYKGWS